MFNNIFLGNFKAFGSTQRIPIRPLTLIFGPNSAGKSSFIHSLLFAHEAHNSDEVNNLDVKRPGLGGDSVDLGGFRQFVHKKDIANRVEWGVEIVTADFDSDRARRENKEAIRRLAERFAPVQTVSIILTVTAEEMAVKVEDPHELPLKAPGFEKKLTVTVPRDGISTGNRSIEAISHEPRVESYRIEADGVVLLRASSKRRGSQWRMGVDELDTDHPVIHNIVKAVVELSTTTDTLHAEDAQTIEEAVDQLVPDLSLILGTFLPRGVQRGDRPQPEGLQQSVFPISKGNRERDLREAIQFWLPRSLHEMVCDLSQLIGTRINTLSYLGPLRSYPPRHLAFAQYHDPNWHAGGGFAWDLVRTNASIREKVNEWLGSEKYMKTPYQLVVRNLYADDDLYDPLWSMLENIELDEEIDGDREGPTGTYPIIKDLDQEVDSFYDRLRKSDLESVQDLVLMDVKRKTVVSHRDIGIGVSQVLPVLVSAFAANHRSVAIEQPEIHLHPALQSELGDVFINAALGENRYNHFLIETHSEHLMLRIMRRIRETNDGDLPEGAIPIRADDVVVLYVDPRETGSGVRVLELDDEGDFLDPWPGGFFEEGFRERFGL